MNTLIILNLIAWIILVLFLLFKIYTYFIYPTVIRLINNYKIWVKQVDIQTFCRCWANPNYKPNYLKLRLSRIFKPKIKKLKTKIKK